MSDDSALFTSRRGILISAIAVAVPVVSGCGVHLEHSDGGKQTPGPDKLARAAVAAKLSGAYSQADEFDAPHKLAGMVEQIRVMLAGQLAALNEPVGATRGSTSHPGSHPGSRPTGTFSGHEPTTKSVVKRVAAVRDESRELLTGVSGDFARRLAGISAASATAADVYGSAADVRVPPVAVHSSMPAPSPDESSSAGTALADLGRSVYAAIYGYEALTVKLTGSTREAAADRLGELRELARTIAKRMGKDAPTPKAGYSLPYPVDNERTAKRLAVDLEARLALHIGAAISHLSGRARPTATTWLTRASLSRWRFSGRLPVVAGSRLPDDLPTPTKSGPATPTRGARRSRSPGSSSGSDR